MPMTLKALGLGGYKSKSKAQSLERQEDPKSKKESKAKSNANPSHEGREKIAGAVSRTGEEPREGGQRVEDPGNLQDPIHEA